MRRSGRINNVGVPAFFTRSKAKNFFNTNSSGTPNHSGKKQEQPQGGIEQPGKQQEEIVENEKKNSQTSKQKVQINQTEGSDEKSKNSSDVKTPLEESEESKSDVKVPQPSLRVEKEMKLVEQEVNVRLTNTDNGGPPDHQSKTASATTKALEQLQVTSAGKNVKKKFRRRKLNERLNRILMPKSGLMFLHELKPGCSFKIQEQPGSNPPVFLAQVEYNDKVIAIGQGMTKPTAKNAAAENAIKVLVAEALTPHAVKREKTDDDQGQKCSSNDSTSTVDELMDTSEDLSLAGLASFAMYKMFTEWQSQGTDFPVLPFQPKRKLSVSKNPPIKKELPPNAEKLHPSFLLNTMRPGVMSVELERLAKDNGCRVTMGYEIDGKMYKGSGSNKKQARKRAAQVVLSELYGLNYED